MKAHEEVPLPGLTLSKSSPSVAWGFSGHRGFYFWLALKRFQQTPSAKTRLMNRIESKAWNELATTVYSACGLYTFVPSYTAGREWRKKLPFAHFRTPLPSCFLRSMSFWLSDRCATVSTLFAIHLSHRGGMIKHYLKSLKRWRSPQLSGKNIQITQHVLFIFYSYNLFFTSSH